MPAPTPQLGSFQYVQETKADLDWADLITVDLSLFPTPAGREELARILITAVREKGFFHVKNFNISQERVNNQLSIGRDLFDLPLEEKQRYTVDGLDHGKCNGYIPAGRRILEEKSGLRDQIEIYNIPKFTEHFEQKHPKIIDDRIAEIEEFAKSLHTEVLDPLHVLLAIALELPEDYFTSRHKYEVKSEDHLRYMKYNKYTSEEYAKLGEFVVRGHTDLGSWTLLFRQPVAGLQINDYSSGEWKWVKPQDATLTVNACDALNFLTANYVKSTIHRVAVPPRDQQHVDRLGLLYFSRPHNNLKLSTITESPLLQREGFTQNHFEATGNPVPTVEEWTFAKQKWQRTGGYSTAEYENAQILPGWNERKYT